MEVAVSDNAGLPRDAEYDESQQVVTAHRYLTNDQYTDAAAKAAAEVDARAAVDALVEQLGLDFNDTPQLLWLADQPLSGGPGRGYSLTVSVRVRPGQS
jgi:hypothetical protein